MCRRLLLLSTLFIAAASANDLYHRLGSGFTEAGSLEGSLEVSATVRTRVAARCNGRRAEPCRAAPLRRASAPRAGPLKSHSSSQQMRRGQRAQAPPASCVVARA